jgi:membrane protein YqaA with SNARE-associated domain
MVSLSSVFIENLAELGYLGALLAGFIGSSTLFIAVFPSVIVIPIIGSQLNPLIVGIVAGLGAGVGQYLHYYIGSGAGIILNRKKNINVDLSKKDRSIWIDRIKKYGVVLIFVFAATPLTPDDLLWIPLGIMKYPKIPALAAAIAGKIVLNLAYSYAGSIGFNIIN